MVYPNPDKLAEYFDITLRKTNPIYHDCIGCPLATFMTQICELYSLAIFGHRVNIDLNGINLLEFPKYPCSTRSGAKKEHSTQ
jgi:hypothetical protein